MASDVKSPPQTPNGTANVDVPIANGKRATWSGTAAVPEANNSGPLFADTASDVSASDAGPDSEESPSSSRVVSPITSPPYWMMNVSSACNTTGSNAGNAPRPLSSHNRTASAESVLLPGAITLQDNEDGPETSSGGGEGNVYGRDRNRACWAKSVEVVSHVVVNGSTTNIGAFVVWNIRVETLNGSFMNIRKRYSEFDDFRRQLVQTFPGFEAAVPVLPPKSVISKFRPRFLEKRRAGLQYFLNCILLNPEFSGSPVLKDFLFS